MPNPLPDPDAASSPTRSCGNDCQTRSESEPSAPSRWKTSSAPSQPSLSWIAVTPREFAIRIPSREASTISSSEGAA